jgi:hypothetical protein
LTSPSPMTTVAAYSENALSFVGVPAVTFGIALF